jgi:hypothetical protein
VTTIRCPQGACALRRRDHGRAKAFAEAEAVGLVVEVDFDAPFVLLHGIG